MEAAPRARLVPNHTLRRGPAEVVTMLPNKPFSWQVNFSDISPLQLLPISKPFISYWVTFLRKRSRRKNGHGEENWSQRENMVTEWSVHTSATGRKGREGKECLPSFKSDPSINQSITLPEASNPQGKVVGRKRKGFSFGQPSS